jgi:hypothetical protein
MPSVVQARVCHPQSEQDLRAAPAADRASDGKLAYSVLEFSKASDLSRSLLYEAIRLGDLQSIKVRGRRLILAEDGKAWLHSFRVPE